MVDEAPEPAGLTGGVDTEMNFMNDPGKITDLSLFLPILLSFVFEIIHVTPLADIHGVLGLQISGSSNVDQLEKLFTALIPLPFRP